MKIVTTFFFSLVLSLTIWVLKPDYVGAISSNLVIMQLQTAGAVSGTSSEEIIVLYNSSNIDINVTDWCLEYSSASNGVIFSNLSCVDPGDQQTELWVTSGGFISFATSEFKTKNPSFVSDFMFGAGLAATGGHVRLVDGNKQEIDRVNWGVAVVIGGISPVSKHTDGKVLSRNSAELQLDTDVYPVDFSSKLLLSPIISGVYEVEILVDLCPNITGIQLDFPAGFLTDNDGNCYEDLCPNIDELQVALPAGYEKKLGSADCTLVPLEDAIIFITELVANAPSTDTGQEFIELYNPLDKTINLVGYKLQVGPNFIKEFIFPTLDILAGHYMVFKDSQTLIVLPNTTGVKLRLVSPAGTVVSETPIYGEASDDVSWALVEDQWIYTNQTTPSAANKPYLEPVEIEVVGATTAKAPCPDGKYRNLETNRCRTIETAVSQLAACDEDEYRNPDTNRCRRATALSILAACGSGKVRSTETNRCRNIASSTVLANCAAGQVRSAETNRCRKTSVLGNSLNTVPTVTDIAAENTAGHINWIVIAAVLTGAFAYITYEWRSELSHLYVRTRTKI